MLNEINFEEGLKSPEKARIVVKQIQEAMDELVEARDESLRVSKKALAMADDYKKYIDTLTDTNIDMASAIKNIHIVLNQKKDLFKDDESMESLFQSLAVFVVSSGAIKLGVLDEARKNAK